MTEDVLQLIHKRDQAYSSFLKEPSEAKRSLYKSLRNQTIAAVKHANRIFFIESASKSSKQFWQNIKLCTGFGKQKQFRTPWPCDNARSASSSATVINKHFTDSVTNIVNNLQNNGSSSPKAALTQSC
jgi:hypothetical protein